MSFSRAMRRFINRWAGLASLGLIGLLIQDYFHGLEIDGRWLVVAIVLLSLAMLVTLVTWEPVSTRVMTRTPYVLVPRDAAIAAAQSDAQLADEALRQVKRLGDLLGQHTRYAPDFVDEREEDHDSRASWARSVNRSQKHEQATVARFFEEHYADVTAVATQLHARDALTDREIRELNFHISNSARAFGHGLPEIGPILIQGANRLKKQ